MRIKNNESNTNFGWSAKTHKALTQAATNKVNKVVSKNSNRFVFDTKLLTEASILPDKEAHAVAAHSADITKLRDSDAFASFQQLDKNIRAMIKSKHKEGLSEDIGRAIHYLQDMQNPLHVNNVVKPSSEEMNFHKKFETEAIGIQHETIKYAKGLQFDKPQQFSEFLNAKMKESKVMANYITRNIDNLKNVLAIEQQGLINSYQVTYKYLCDLAELMK